MVTLPESEPKVGDRAPEAPRSSTYEYSGSGLWFAVRGEMLSGLYRGTGSGIAQS